MANIIEKAKARLKEARGSAYTLYHKSYTDAINHALSHHQKSGLNVSDDDRFQHVGVGSKKPSEGNTTSVSIPATHTNGKKHMVHVQVFNKGGTHPYELNTYSSGMGRNVKEAADNYPREGFPKEGDYGYHSNPGLKPQESDSDEDMDVAYKKATEKEGRKPLNAKITEGVTNPEIKKAYADLIKTPGGSSERKSAIRRYKSLRQNALKEEKELEEAHGMWKVDFPKQHAGKAVAAGSVHVKAQNTAHAHKVAAKRVGVDHKMFKSKVTKSSVLPEELEQVNEYNNYRKAGKDPFAARKQYIAMDRAEKKGVMPGSSTSTADAIAAFKAKGGKITKLDTKGNMKEELGKSNEWGTDALRKKYAAMTPGQESMAADKIPSFDPRYDNVTTQHLGLHPVREGYLAEISAKASIARDEFRRKMQKALTDPKNIARAKKVLAKKKEAEKAKEAPHLLM